MKVYKYKTKSLEKDHYFRSLENAINFAIRDTYFAISIPLVYKDYDIYEGAHKIFLNFYKESDPYKTIRLHAIVYIIDTDD